VTFLVFYSFENSWKNQGYLAFWSVVEAYSLLEDKTPVSAIDQICTTLLSLTLALETTYLAKLSQYSKDLE
jgi:hypothetical protein